MGMSNGAMGGGFFGGMGQAFQSMQDQARMRQWFDMFETMNQNQARPDGTQGPMKPLGGISLRNRLLSGMRPVGFGAAKE